VTQAEPSGALTSDAQFELLLRQVAGVSATPTAIEATPPLPVGSTLGPYRLVEVVGAGGMGVVYRAHDSRLQRDVALKLLPGHTSLDDAARQRLLNEARVAARLSHPNLASVYEAGTLQIHRRISTPEALVWTEKTRNMYAGTYFGYAFGRLDERCFSIPHS